MENIRILHVLQRMEAGGTQALLMNLYRNIDREKVQFDFLVEYDYKEFYDDEIKRLGGRIYYSNVRKDYNLIKFKKMLKEIILKNNYKIIHVHASNVGYIVFSIARKLGVKVRIAHAHNNNSVKDIRYIPRTILRKLYVKKATDYFACSNDAAEFFFNKKQFIVLNNSIDSKKFIFDNKKRIMMRENLKLKDSFVVGHIGRLHMQKNHKFLIDIFEQIKKKKENAKLILIGDGPLENEIREYLSIKQLEKDTILLKNRRDIPELLFAMDVFILPSLFEGLGIVCIEAQAAGTPCLVSDHVPKITNITDLIGYEKLTTIPEIWAEEAIKLANSKNAHTNTQDKIINANFDIKSTAKFLQNFYITKYNQNYK